jgi:NAD(P)-dependent dehydrogenase (short-subunit alcohol dehydrogenase family)
MAKLDGQVAIVTGAGQGIGHGVAVCLAQAGARVVAADAVSARAAQTAADIRALGGEALGVQTDVTRVDSVNSLVYSTFTHFGKIDILVNNAGVVVVKPIMDQTEADWDRVLDVNLKGVFLCCHRVVQEMVKQQSGAIVNIASIAAFHYTVPHVPYAASKAGVVAITRDLAFEVAHHGVRVNAIAPGPIETPMMSSALTQQQREAYAKSIPLKRLGQPRDIGNAVVFLASADASFVTGVTLPVSGGTDLKVTNS